MGDGRLAVVNPVRHLMNSSSKCKPEVSDRDVLANFVTSEIR